MYFTNEDDLCCKYCGEEQGIEYVKNYMAKNNLTKVVIKCYDCDLSNTVMKTKNGFYRMNRTGLSNYIQSLKSRKSRYNKKQIQLIQKAIEDASKKRTSKI